ncbi:MAG: hypothetical protein RIB84_01540 [Sneathiellaceae bacterium]
MALQGSAGMAAGRRRQGAAQAGSPQEGPPRWPVPLPLHLALSNLILGSSCAALPLARSGSINWSPACRDAAADLQPLLQACPPEQLGPAVLQAALDRLARVQAGIERYAATPAARPDPVGPVIWQSGTTRLHDGAPGLAGSAAPHVLLVPSLINRAYILALGPERGLVGHLAAQGIRPLLLDWDAPGAEERLFDVAGYVEQRLRPALDLASRAVAAGGRPPVILGYCMGGMLALAGLLREAAPARLASGLALVATPWDFAADPLFAAVGEMMSGQEAAMRAWLGRTGALPPEFLQGLFVLRDPALPLRKFGGFAAMPDDGPQAAAFRGLEGWANDGVPLAGPAAEDCLFDWFGRNAPARGAWHVCGTVMRPEALALPAFAAIAGRDRLVPPASAAALIDRLPDVATLQVAGGHVGMVAGPGAAEGLWRPLTEWVLARCSAA